MQKSFFTTPWVRAAATLFSTIVGAGIFGIPFVFAHVGVVVGVAMLVGMGALLWGVQASIGELVIATRKHMQLTGFVRAACGTYAAWAMAAVFFLLHCGALVAYLIGEGQSLAALCGGPAVMWSVLFFIVGTCVIMRGVRAISIIDGVVGVGVIGILVYIVVVGARHAGRVVWLPAGDASLFTAYGVFLFALHGASAIPGMELVVGADARGLRRAIAWGSLVPLVLYAVFASAVVAVTGRDTTQVATIGLGHALGSWVVVVGNVCAVLAMGTSFITIGQSLTTSLRWDFGMQAHRALAYALGIPLVVFLAGARSFISVVSFVGATAGSVELLLLVVTYWRFRHRRK